MRVLLSVLDANSRISVTWNSHGTQSHHPGDDPPGSPPCCDLCSLSRCVIRSVLRCDRLSLRRSALRSYRRCGPGNAHRSDPGYLLRNDVRSDSGSELRSEAGSDLSSLPRDELRSGLRRGLRNGLRSLCRCEPCPGPRSRPQSSSSVLVAHSSIPDLLVPSANL
jgi:hypothetical protein